MHCFALNCMISLREPKHGGGTKQCGIKLDQLGGERKWKSANQAEP